MFHSLNTKFLNHTLIVNIENIEACNNHWRSTKAIHQIAEDLELLLLKVDTFIAAENELLHYLLTFNSQNHRIETIKFFIDPAPKSTFVCVCVSNVTTFKPENFLKRNILIDFKKQGKRLLFTDVTAEEWKAVTDTTSDKVLPATWQANDSLTKKYEKYKSLFL